VKIDMHANINYSHDNHRKLEKIINQQKENHLNNNRTNGIYLMSKHDMKLKDNNILKMDFTKIERQARWREENKDILSEKQKEYNKRRQHIRNAQDVERRKNDPQFRILCATRGRIGQLLKQNKTNRTTELLGCSLEIFKSHLESQFKPEMNWDNYGEIWEVDHIKPCSSFDLTDIEQQKQCFHYTNTQPLFKTTEIAESFGYNEIGNRNKSNYEK
jgi:23S rRNA maturation mini-RNase III